MTGQMSGSRVTVLPESAPRTALADLVLTGKAGLTWGGRYWVRTSDLFGVNQVTPIVYAGQTANCLVGSGLERPRTAWSTPEKPVSAPSAPTGGPMPPLTPGVDTRPASGRVIDPTGLTPAMLSGDRCPVPNCRRSLTEDKTLLGQTPDGTPIFICGDHDRAEVLIASGRR